VDAQAGWRHHQNEIEIYLLTIRRGDGLTKSVQTVRPIRSWIESKGLSACIKYEAWTVDRSDEKSSRHADVFVTCPHNSSGTSSPVMRLSTLSLPLSMSTRQAGRQIGLTPPRHRYCGNRRQVALLHVGEV